MFFYKIPPSQWDLEYAEGISCTWVRISTPQKKQCPEHDTKLHLMVSSEDLRSMEYSFIAIAPRFTLTQSGISVRVPSLSQID